MTGQFRVIVDGGAPVWAQRLEVDLNSVLNQIAQTTTSSSGDTIYLKDFGATGTTNDVATWNAAIAAANASGNKTIQIPAAGTTLAASPTAITGNNVTFTGGKVTFGASASLIWGSPTVQVSGGGMRNVEIVGPGSGTSVQISLPNAALMDFDTIKVSGVTVLARMGVSGGTSVNTIRFRNIYGSAANVAAPIFDCVKGSGFWLMGANLQGEGVAPAAFNTTSTWAANTSRDLVDFVNDSWDTAQISDVFTFGLHRAVRAVAGSGKVIQNIQIHRNWLDGLGGGILFTANSGGTIVRVEVLDNPYITSWDLDGVLFSGTGSHIGHKVNRNGINSVGGSGVYFAASCKEFQANDNIIYGYSRIAAGYAAVWVEGGAQGFQIQDNNLNPDMSALGFSWSAPYGLRIDADCDRYAATGNTARGSSAAFQIADNTAGSTNRRIAENVGANYRGSKTGGVYVTPATGVAWTNKSAYVLSVHVRGAVTSVQKNGFAAAGMGAPTDLIINPGETFTIVAPGVAGTDYIAHFFAHP